MSKLDLDKINISSKEDFIKYVHLLSDDYKENHGNWENASVDKYLDALAAWAGDMEGYYEFWKKDAPKNVNWSVIWDLLIAARDYE